MNAMWLRMGAFAISLSVACSVFGDGTAYLVSTDAAGTSAWTNAYKWAVGSASGDRLGPQGGALPADYDYVVSGSKMVRTDFSGKNFPGRSLAIGELPLKDGMLVLISNSFGERFTASSLTLACGTMATWYGYGVTMSADFTVTAPETAPFKIYSNRTTADDITLEGSFAGDTSAAIWVHARSGKGDTATTPSVRLCFTGDMLKDYAGLITCHPYSYANRNDEILAGVSAKIASGTVVSPAKVVLYPNCTIGGKAATDVFSVGSLTAKPGSKLELAYDKDAQKVSCVAVTGELAIEDKLIVSFDPNVGTSYTSQPVLPKSPIFKAPAGVTLDINDFVFDCTTIFPVYDLFVEEDEDGVSTLFIQQHGAVITQKTGDSSNDYSTGNDSFRSGAHWSVTVSAPTDANIYYSAIDQRAYPQSNYTAFPGHTLAKNGGGICLFSLETRIEDLRILGGNVWIYNYRGGSDWTRLTGRVLQRTGVTSGLKCAGTTSRKLDIGSDIEGTGLLRFVVSDDTTSYVRVSGDNSGFVGKYLVGAESNPRSESKHLEFYCSSAASMGGPMTAWTYDGHRFCEYVNINVENSMELDRANCGWFVDGFSSLTCPDDVTLTLKERVTWKGALTKKGAGTFALGGPAPYFNSDKGATPTADKNVLNISAGALKPLSAEAFNGVALNFDAGTTLALEVPDDPKSVFGTRGMSVTGTGAALTLPEGGITVTIGDPSARLSGSNHRIPICTVSSGNAASVRGKFTVASWPQQERRQASVEETVNDDGTVTFSVVLNVGFLLLFR